jgi:flagellar biosynthesis GTPase FlhF
MKTTTNGACACRVPLAEVVAEAGVSVEWVAELRPHLGVDFELSRDWRGYASVSVPDAALLFDAIVAHMAAHAQKNRIHQDRIQRAAEARLAAEREAMAKARAESRERTKRLEEARRQQAEDKAAQAAAEAERARWERAGRPPSFEQVSKEYDKEKARTV